MKGTIVHAVSSAYISILLPVCTQRGETPQGREQVSKPWLHPSFLRTAKTSLIWVTFMDPRSQKHSISNSCTNVWNLFQEPKGLRTHFNKNYTKEKKNVLGLCLLHGEDSPMLLQIASNKSKCVTIMWFLEMDLLIKRFLNNTTTSFQLEVYTCLLPVGALFFQRCTRCLLQLPSSVL